MHRFLGLLVLVVLAVVPAAPAGASGAQGPERGRAVVLVANAEGGTVSIVDARAFRVLRTVDVLPDGAVPDPMRGDPPTAAGNQALIESAGGKNYAQDQDLSPDGRTLYVSRGHRGDVAAFDLATGTLRWKRAVSGLRADHMTLTPDGRRVVVSALTADEVLVLDAASGAVLGRAPTAQWPHDNHVSEDGERLFNASIGTIVAPEGARGSMGRPPYAITVIDLRSYAVVRSIELDAGIRPIVFTDDERRAFAQLSQFSGLVEIDLVAGREVRRLELPVKAGTTEDDYDFEAPHHGLALSGDGKTLCAAGRISDYGALVDVASLKPTAIIPLGDAPGWAATGPLGEHCFLPNTREDTLSVVSYASRTEVARIGVGDGPKQLEAARIPEDVLCTAPTVPGCSGDLRLRATCAPRGRLTLSVDGDLDAVEGVRWSARGRRVGRDSTRPYLRTVSARTARRLRGRRLQAQVATSGAPRRLTARVPRCR